MQLLYTLNSPYARKTRIVALEKHLAVTFKEVVLADPDCPVNTYNPLGKVPVLITEEGDIYFDSPVIAEFLDGLNTSPSLFPLEFHAKMHVKRIEALADGICDAAVSVMLEQRKPETQQSMGHIEKQTGKVLAGLAALDKELYKKKWCCDDIFSLADIAVGCALGYFDMRFGDLRWDGLSWQEKFPNLAKYYSVLVKRPSFKQTMPPGY